MSKKIQQFAEKLVELSDHHSEGEIIDILITALDGKLEKVNGQREKEIVKQVQRLVESHYKLREGALDNSFKQKDRTLTEAKFMWIVITLHVFNGDRNKTEKHIKNGVTRQKVYTCMKTFEELSDKVPHEKEIKETYKIIIQSYG